MLGCSIFFFSLAGSLKEANSMPFRPWHIHKLFWDESSEFCGLYILKGERRHCMVNIYLKQQVGEKNSLIKVQDQVEKKKASPKMPVDLSIVIKILFVCPSLGTPCPNNSPSCVHSQLDTVPVEV